jgi:cobalamin synthase
MIQKRLGNEKIDKKLGLVGFFTVFVVVLFSLSSFVALAQYETQTTAPFTISSSGVAHVTQSSTVGSVSIDITGTPSATGSVSTAIYNGNPQPDASMAANITLTYFVAVTFDIPANYFQSANITISYSDAAVAGINPPYALYKYSSGTNSYVELSSVVDTSAKTITATVTSTTDPLLAIGGTTALTATPTAVTSAVPPWIWVVVATVIVVIALVVVVLLTHPESRIHTRRTV